MTTPLSQEQLAEFQRILEARYRDLRELISRELLKADDEQFSELAGRVHDLEEASVADLLVDLNLATIDLHLGELKEVEDALKRIREGSYGECVDCHGPVGLERLKAYPTARRCIECQAHYERTHRHPGTPSL